MALYESDFAALQPGVNAITNQAAETARAKQADALKKYLQQQEPELAGQKQARQNQENLKTLQSPEMQEQLNTGGSAKAGDLSIGADPYSRVMLQGPHQANTLLSAAKGAYKDINSSLDASQTTLDNLNLGTAAGDKAAAISEAGLMLHGGRGIPSIVPMLSGDSTMASDAQKSMNWLQNTPNIPTLQPAQRDSLREMIYARLAQTKQQHQQAAQQLAQQGPIVAPQTDYNGIINSFVTPTQQKLDALEKSQSQYEAQRQKMQQEGNAPISNPATANANPTTLDRLKSFFGGGSSAQPSAPGNQAKPVSSVQGAQNSVPDHSAALTWAKANPKDPRAAQILQAQQDQ